MIEHMLSVILMPVLKNKSNSICDKNNYRPIALTSILSKVLEYVLYQRLEPYLETCSNQFGFKKKYGSDLAILTLKEIVLKYRSLNSNV